MRFPVRPIFTALGAIAKGDYPGRGPSGPSFDRAREWRAALNVLRAVVGKLPSEIKLLPLLFLLRKPNLLQEDHPWLTGRDPSDNQPVWPKNVLWSTPAINQSPSDAEIVSTLGRYLAALARRSLQPRKKADPPHFVNYVHAAVHFSSAFCVFNGFEEASRHFADPAFVAALRRFVEREEREIVLVFRQRSYAPVDFAYFTSYVISQTGWFTNANGSAQRQIHAGNHSPYPANNVITGAWLRDVIALARSRKPLSARPALNGDERERYFPGDYGRQPPAFYPVAATTFALLQNEKVNNRGSSNVLVHDRRRYPARHRRRLAEKRRGLNPRIVDEVELDWRKPILEEAP